MAAWGRYSKTSCRISSKLFPVCKQARNSARRLTSGNLLKVPSTSRCFLGQDSVLLKAARKQISKMEMQQLQRSAAVMSLSSKVSSCLGLTLVSDSDLAEAGDDTDEVCSQPGHKSKKSRRKSILQDTT